MKVGIITFQKIGNYGADLQAYALQRALGQLGYDAENIDYPYYKDKHFRATAKSRPTHPVSRMNKIKAAVYPWVMAVKNFRRHDLMGKRARRFAAFEERIVQSREYRSADSLYEDPPQYDVYIAGSDQIWNPRINTNIEPYFLGFAPAGAKCISYASSFGVSDLPGPVFCKYKQLLKRFSSISVREDAGARLVRSMALGVEVEHVVDPTLLLTADKWMDVACEPTKNEKTRPRAYLLLYDLIACADTVATAERIAAEKGLEIVRIGDGDYGPGEFLWLFAHSDCVVTNSFHGTVFSILNHKPFVTVIPKKMTNSSRIDSLLASVGLVYDNLAVTDWSAVDVRLDALRNDSLAFLRRAIEDPSRKVEQKIPLGCYALINKDEAIRAESTSGGAFTALAAEIIKRGGIVYGAAFDKDFHRVRHIAAETLEGLSPIRKSKYVWSDPIWAYRDAKEKVFAGRFVLFSGTPCQCAAMRKMVGENDRLITIDFVCHGTPKAEAFERYAIALERTAGSTLVDYQFREKKDGWNFQRIAYRFKNGKSRRVIPWLDPYFRAFSLNQGLKTGCYRCPYANLERPSDITIADAWRIGASLPEFDDNRGTSNVLVNTVRGQKLFHRLMDCVSNNRIFLVPYSLDEAQMRNHALMMPSVLMTKSRPLLYYRLVYWVKRLGWNYFRSRQ